MQIYFEKREFTYTVLFSRLWLQLWGSPVGRVSTFILARVCVKNNVLWSGTPLLVRLGTYSLKCPHSFSWVPRPYGSKSTVEFFQVSLGLQQSFVSHSNCHVFGVVWKQFKCKWIIMYRGWNVSLQLRRPFCSIKILRPVPGKRVSTLTRDSSGFGSIVLSGNRSVSDVPVWRSVPLTVGGGSLGFLSVTHQLCPGNDNTLFIGPRIGDYH